MDKYYTAWSTVALVDCPIAPNEGQFPDTRLLRRNLKRCISLEGSAGQMQGSHGGNAPATELLCAKAVRPHSTWVLARPHLRCAMHSNLPSLYGKLPSLLLRGALRCF